MKKITLILKIIALVILIPFALVSFIGFFQGDYIEAIITFILFGAPSVFLIKSMITKKAKKLPIEKTEVKVIEQIPVLLKQEVIKPLRQSNNQDIIHFSKMEGKTKQLLESLEIIHTTTRIDTLSGRIEFVNSIYPDFINCSRNGRFSLEVQKGIDLYKTMYYDRMITDIQMHLLLFPNPDELKSHFSDCIANCYKRYVERQKVEMQKLVRPAAIEKRREDLIRQGYDAKYMFKTFELPDNGNIDIIESIRQQFFYHQFKNNSSK